MGKKKNTRNDNIFILFVYLFIYLYIIFSFGDLFCVFDNLMSICPKLQNRIAELVSIIRRKLPTLSLSTEHDDDS